MGGIIKTTEVLAIGIIPDGVAREGSIQIHWPKLPGWEKIWPGQLSAGNIRLIVADLDVMVRTASNTRMAMTISRIMVDLRFMKSCKFG